MNSILKNTKIIATTGPSLTGLLNTHEDVEIHGKETYGEVLDRFEALMAKGVNCIRFNFSHSNTPERLFRLDLFKEVIARISDHAAANLPDSKFKFIRPFSIMCDTKGPEIRVYEIGNPDGQEYLRDTVVTIHCIQKVIGDATKFSVFDSTGTYNMANDCIVGNKILIDDGKLSLKILSSDKAAGIVTALVENTHTFKTNKRINLPGAEYSMPFLSDKDIADVKFALDKGYHSIALSFVNKAEDIKSVRKILADHNVEGKKIPAIFTKIETLCSIKNLQEIVDESDGVMIARGDLSLEIPYWEVPYWSKQIIKACAIKNIPVIMATQMLDSLERNIIPTRAEVTDVYRAVELGCDCTMLSGESAQGLFPTIAVDTMSAIALESEKRLNYPKFFEHFNNHPKFKNNNKIIKLINDAYNLIYPYLDEVIGAAAFAPVASSDLILAFSLARMPISLTIFHKVNSLEDTNLQAALIDYSLTRNIYPVGVLNLNEQDSLLSCYLDYVNSYLYNSISLQKKAKVLLFLDNGWKLVNI